MSTESKARRMRDRGEDVAGYLADHPDFFLQHEALLCKLRIPHASGQAVSLLERQVQLLRDQLDASNERLQQLIEIARENEALADRIHHLTLALIECRSYSELATLLNEELFVHFQADAVELRLFSPSDLDPAPGLPKERLSLASKFRAFLDNGDPFCGALDSYQLNDIFGPAAETIGSTALLPLRGPGRYGFLAIGSRSPERFGPGKGTLFLRRLSEMVSQCLHMIPLPGV